MLWYDNYEQFFFLTISLSFCLNKYLIKFLTYPFGLVQGSQNVKGVKAPTLSKSQQRKFKKMEVGANICFVLQVSVTS